MPVQIIERKNKLAEALEIVVTGAPAVSLAAATADLDNQRRMILAEAKSGRKYPRLPNRSSAPGEAPANQFGVLLASIPDEPVVMDDGALGAGAGDGSGVATYMEFGTSRIAPRPFVGPSGEVGAEVAEQGQRDIAAKLAAL